MSITDQLKAAKRETAKREAELQAVRDDLESARRAMAEGRGLEAEEQLRLKEQLEAEREKRIEHTKQMAMVRLAKRDLSKGWL